MTVKKSLILLLSAGLVMSLCGTLAAQDKSKARDVFNKNKDSVLWVTAVVKSEVTGAGQKVHSGEQKVQALGTVIDASGLIVVSHAQMDPLSLFDKKSRPIQGIPTLLSVASTHSELKIVLPDGTEVAGRLVMTDAPLDLAFIVPEKADKRIGASFVDMSKSAKVELLDELVNILRMPKHFDQVSAVATSEVSGIMTKPRTYIFGGRIGGSPVFKNDGSVVGLTVAYRAETEETATQTPPATVILPAEEVAKVAKQALEAAKKAPTTASTQPATAPAGEAATKPAGEAAPTGKAEPAKADPNADKPVSSDAAAPANPQPPVAPKVETDPNKLVGGGSNPSPGTAKD